VDCVEQGCECCTECSSTKSPTLDPTKVPTRYPTISPTVSPTISPSSPPIVQVPTSSPSVCSAEISVLDFCFAPSANIGVSFSNCNIRRDDWVGIYLIDDNFDKSNLANPELWSWACGTRNCNEAVSNKIVSLNNIHANNDKWPLKPGIYIAVLARNTAQPYSSYAVSETFVVATQC